MKLFAIRGLVGIALVLLVPLAACEDDAPATVNDAGPDAGICCPIESRGCDCSYIGGTRDAFGHCAQLCDAPPPSLQETIDANGCPVLKSVPYSGRSCGSQPDTDSGFDGGDASPDADSDANDASPGSDASDAAVDGDLP